MHLVQGQRTRQVSMTIDAAPARCAPPTRRCPTSRDGGERRAPLPRRHGRTDDGLRPGALQEQEEAGRRHHGVISVSRQGAHESSGASTNRRCRGPRHRGRSARPEHARARGRQFFGDPSTTGQFHGFLGDEFQLHVDVAETLLIQRVAQVRGIGEGNGPDARTTMPALSTSTFSMYQPRGSAHASAASVAAPVFRRSRLSWTVAVPSGSQQHDEDHDGRDAPATPPGMPAGFVLLICRSSSPEDRHHDQPAQEDCADVRQE